MASFNQESRAAPQREEVLTTTISMLNCSDPPFFHRLPKNILYAMSITAPVLLLYRATYVLIHNHTQPFSFPWRIEVDKFILSEMHDKKYIPTMDSHCRSRWRCLYACFQVTKFDSFGPCLLFPCMYMYRRIENDDRWRRKTTWELDVTCHLNTPVVSFRKYERTMPIWSRFCCFHFHGVGETEIQTFLAAHSARSEYSAAKCASGYLGPV